MTQAVVQSGVNAWAGGAAAIAVTLNGCVQNNYLEVRIGVWGGTIQPNCTISDGTHTYALAARAQELSNTFDRSNAEVHYVKVSANGNYTVTVTHPSGTASERYGTIWVGEISGRDGTSPLNSGASGTATGSSTTPSVTGAGSTTDANSLRVGAVAISNSDTTAGVDAATGNSLSWTNRSLGQDGTQEAYSFDDAPATANSTPTVSWGTLDATATWAAVVVAFKDAVGGGGGGADGTAEVYNLFTVVA